MASGATSIVLFFIFSVLCLGFVIAWIIKSESKIKTSKAVIERLKNQTVSTERDKYMLAEKVSEIEKSPASGGKPADAFLKKQNESLEGENQRLNAELNEARKSLEEVYKALNA